MATLARARAACKSLPGSTFDIKWGADMCYSVGGKMFAVIGDPAGQSISFKVDDHRFLELTDREGFVPAPYLAKHKWVLVKDVKKVSDAELSALITRSYELVAAKLPKKLRPKAG
jgi:predicted DNA-binding protein (MmcQ/YjbR family)